MPPKEQKTFQPKEQKSFQRELKYEAYQGVPQEVDDPNPLIISISRKQPLYNIIYALFYSNFNHAQRSTPRAFSKFIRALIEAAYEYQYSAKIENLEGRLVELFGVAGEFIGRTDHPVFKYLQEQIVRIKEGRNIVFFDSNESNHPFEQIRSIFADMLVNVISLRGEDNVKHQNAILQTLNIYRNAELELSQRTITPFMIGLLGEILFETATTIYLHNNFDENNRQQIYELLVESANLGNAEARYSLGKIYSYGDKDWKFIKKNWFKAAKNFQAAINGGIEDARIDLEQIIGVMHEDSRDPEIAYELGLCYKEGVGVKRDLVKALRYFQFAKDSGLEKLKMVHTDIREIIDFTLEKVEISERYNHLGIFYKNGYGVDKNYDEAFRYFKKGAELGNHHAKTNLGICYKNGLGVGRDINLAVHYLKEAAEQGNISANYNLSLIYQSGFGEYHNPGEAYRYANDAIDRGGNLIYNDMGLFYDNWQEGTNIAPITNRPGMINIESHDGDNNNNSKEELTFLESEAKAGNISSQIKLGRYYLNRSQVTEDLETAFKLFELAADSEDAEAEYYKALCYKNGYGVKPNLMKAHNLFCRSADKGFFEASKEVRKMILILQDVVAYGQDKVKAEAEKNLGLCYRYGLGVEANDDEAFENFDRAARAGNASALNMRGLCYKYGKGTKQDMRKAFADFKLSVKKGGIAAQNNLAICYRDGFGTKEDRQEARQLFNLAIKNKSKVAKDNLDLMDNQPNLEEKKEVKKNVKMVWRKNVSKQEQPKVEEKKEEKKLEQQAEKKSEQKEKKINIETKQIKVTKDAKEKEVKFGMEREEVPNVSPTQKSADENVAEEKKIIQILPQNTEPKNQAEEEGDEPDEEIEIDADKEEAEETKGFGRLVRSRIELERRELRLKREKERVKIAGGIYEERLLNSIEKEANDKKQKAEEDQKGGKNSGQKKLNRKKNNLENANEDFVYGLKFFHSKAAPKSLPKKSSRMANDQKDLKRALLAFGRAQSVGYKPAILYKALCYFEGDETLEKNEDAAIKILNAGLKEKNPYCQYYLGVCYLKGRGVPKNIIRAQNLMNLAAKQGITHAEEHLSKMRIDLGLLSVEKRKFLNKQAMEDFTAQFEKYQKHHDLPRMNEELDELVKLGSEKHKNLKAQYDSVNNQEFKSTKDKKNQGVVEYLSDETRIADKKTGIDEKDEDIENVTIPNRLTYLKILARGGDGYFQFMLGQRYEYGFGGAEQDHKQAFHWYSLAAEKGNSDAQYYLGLVYEEGTLIKKDPKKALRLFRSSAEAGNANSQNKIGQYYWQEKDYENALHWYRLSAKQKYGDAIYNLGICYENGFGVKPDRKEALRYYKSAAENGHSRAMYIIGKNYAALSGQENLEEAMHFMKLAVEKEDSDAQYYAGLCYEKGFGVKPDRKEALKLIVLSAEQGNSDAQCKLGMYHDQGLTDNGEILVQQDHKKAYSLFHLAANRGSADAKYIIGSYYEKGIVVKQDKIAAAEWYKKAGPGLNPEEQRKLALRFNNGEGVTRDMAEAIRLLEFAVQGGDEKAREYLDYARKTTVVMVRTEKETKEDALTRQTAGESNADASHLFAVERTKAGDHKQAVKFHKLAAEQGHHLSQFALGEYYKRGIGGIEQNYETALEFYKLSKHNGFAGAADSIEECESKLAEAGKKPKTNPKVKEGSLVMIPENARGPS